VFLSRQLQGMFTRNQAQSKYWNIQIDKNLATNGSRGSGTRPNQSVLSPLNIVPSDVQRRHMENTDVSRKQKCSRLRASRFYQQNTELTVRKFMHSFVIQLEARSLWFLCDKTRYPARCAVLMAVDVKISLLGYDTVLLWQTGTKLQGVISHRLTSNIR
jgi:hypothetical protein